MNDYLKLNDAASWCIGTYEMIYCDILARVVYRRARLRNRVEAPEHGRPGRTQPLWWTPLSRPKKRFRSVRYRVWIQFHIPTSTGPACPQAFLFAPQTLHRG